MGLFKRRSRELFTLPEPNPAAPDAAPTAEAVARAATGAAAEGAGAAFRLVVDDVFVIRGRGAVVTGTVEGGVVVVGATVTVERAGRAPLAAEVSGIEHFRRKVRQAGPGDSVGLLLPSLARGEVSAGDVVHAG